MSTEKDIDRKTSVECPVFKMASLQSHVNTDEGNVFHFMSNMFMSPEFCPKRKFERTEIKKYISCYHKNPFMQLRYKRKIVPHG
ncbi:hypothetical protein CEXT_426551 [Caerostris extrusa]|uniref:Uncharacterized protein n=1 Tax=Caerostris extrusa TaxID=172846 RepID=A0AAV4Y4M3_CAEEX|nr:hypothetical protein CEXT_426551 [Caerostris extrusa]